MQVELNPIWSGYAREGLDVHEEDVRYINIRDDDAFTVYGLADYHKNYHRIPADIAEQISGGVADKARAAAGGRIRFQTDSPYVAIRVKYKRMVVAAPHMSHLACTGFDLYTKVGGKLMFKGVYYPAMDGFDGYEGLCRFDTSALRECMIHFPLTNEVYEVEIGIKEGSLLQKTAGYALKKPVAMYGSSITHGCGVGRPGMAYSNIISRMLDVDVINYGFSGQAKGEPAMARYIAGLDLSAFVLDYEANAPSVEHLQKTHYPFYEIVRQAHPDLPIIMMTYPRLRMSESGFARRDVIMESYLKARASGDQRVYFLDGYSLYTGISREDCSVDGSHPNDLGAQRIAEVVSGMLSEILY